MYLLKYDDQNQTPHFRGVPTSTDYSKPPTCSVLGTRLQCKDAAFEGWFPASLPLALR